MNTSKKGSPALAWIFLASSRSCVRISWHNLTTVSRSPFEGLSCSFLLFFDLAERRNETGDAHQPGICKQLGNLGDTPDVLLTVFRGEAQVLVQAVTDVVSVQGVTWDGMGYEVLLQSKTDGSLPGTGQTWERRLVSTVSHWNHPWVSTRPTVSQCYQWARWCSLWSLLGCPRFALSCFDWHGGPGTPHWLISLDSKIEEQVSVGRAFWCVWAILLKQTGCQVLLWAVQIYSDQP